MESNRVGLCRVRAESLHNPQWVANDPKNIHFSKIDRVISGFINLLVIPIYDMLTDFGGKYYI
jgi:hypothetical protein